MTGDPTSTIPAPTLPLPALKQRILDWLKQPSTQYGLAAETVLIGAQATGVINHVWGGALAQFLPWCNAGAAFLLFPDNSTDRIKAQDVANATLRAVVTRSPADIAAALRTGAQAVAAEGVAAKLDIPREQTKP